MSKRAIILAGGKGTRLRPYTIVLPKPLMPIGDYPILEVIVRQLKEHDFTNITMAVNHQAEIIKAFFGDGSKWGIKIDYSLEEKALSTMAPLKLIDDLPDNFLVMNGDILTTMDYTKLIAYHREKGGILTIGMHKKRNKVGLGVIETDNNDCLTSYKEKPETEYKVSMGVYVYEPEVLEYIEPEGYLDFPNLVTRLLESGEKVVGYPCSDLWLDIGNHEDYVKAQKIFEESKYKFLPKDVF